MKRDTTEPVRRAGLFAQAFGVLVVADSRFVDVHALSGASANHLGLAIDDALEANAGDILPRGAAHAIRNALGRSTATRMREMAGFCELATGRFEITTHIAGDRAIVELTPAAAMEDAQAGLAALARLNAVDISDSLDLYLERAAVTLQEYCRADRVAVLRREPQGGVTPVTDSRLFGARELLATGEIPAWLENRVIGDAEAAPSAMVCAPGVRDVDLSRALLAAPRLPARREMRDLGMTGSACAPIHVEGRLWGYVAAQAAIPRAMSASVVTVIEIAATLLGSEIGRRERAKENRVAREAAAPGGDPVAAIRSLAERPFDATLPGAGVAGLALVVEDNFLIAEDFASQLRMLGFTRVATAGDLEEARRIIECENVAICLLDLDLRGRMGTELAPALENAGAPFVYLTGHGADMAMRVEPFGRPVLAKPLDRGELLGAVAEMLIPSQEARDG